MSLNFELSIEVSEQYPFHKNALNTIGQNAWVKNQWPLVYFIQNEKEKLAYVGESTNALSRIKNHLGNPDRCKLDRISIIGSDKFNKSATLDIESNLIQYITAEGSFKLQNGNYGLINHNYYQQDLYKDLFKEVWNKLVERKIVTKSLTEIENSELFKYSPYKALNEDQYNSVIEILESINNKASNQIFINGSAGTGKTILATYLIKLLNTEVDTDQADDFNEDELREINLIRKFRAKYPKAKIGFVVAMTSLRESLKAVFKQIPGLKSSMVISPSDTFNAGGLYDLLIVDEAHRLRRYRNIGWRGVFKKNNQKLGLGNEGTELDWIMANSKNQIFFYDPAQSVKPSDVDASRFAHLLNDPTTSTIRLKSQMRVKGGNNYIAFVDELLNTQRAYKQPYQDPDYDLVLFDSFHDFFRAMQQKEAEHHLCRIVAGYSWEWISDPKREKANLSAIDIEIEGHAFQWNQTDKDWINNPKDPAQPLNEIGCIHTVQGYDLNYTGVIFGREINYNKQEGCIEIDPGLYFDKYGRIGADEAELKAYIINIYKTLMYRGIKGTYVYAYHKELRDYLRQHMDSPSKSPALRIIHLADVKPYVNAIPLVDISAAAGSFSELQFHEELTWVEPPFHVSAKEGQFICKVHGESMNKVIPNGSYCLFQKDQGGTRDGKVVLVELTDLKDPESGSRYTVKKYQSFKQTNEDGWQHTTIRLEPMSTDPTFNRIEITNPSENILMRVCGIFIQTI